MSDSGSEDSPGVFPFSVPPEVKAAIMQQHKNIHDLQEQSVRAQDDFIESLSEDHLRLLKGFIIEAATDAAFGSYMAGWLSSILKYKFGVCQYCGDKHATFEDLLAAHPDTKDQS